MIQEPEGPWFINVVHYFVNGRPWCRSPVDYERAVYNEILESSTCAKCIREAV